MVFGALQVIANIDLYEEKVQKKINANYYHRVIDELKEAGFEYFSKATNKEYVLTNEDNKEIIFTSGITLIYKCIVIAVTSEGIYINKPIRLIDKTIELNYDYYVKFSPDMYKTISKIIEGFTMGV